MKPFILLIAPLSCAVQCVLCLTVSPTKEHTKLQFTWIRAILDRNSNSCHGPDLQDTVRMGALESIDPPKFSVFFSFTPTESCDDLRLDIRNNVTACGDGLFDYSF